MDNVKKTKELTLLLKERDTVFLAPKIKKIPSSKIATKDSSSILIKT